MILTFPRIFWFGCFLCGVLGIVMSALAILTPGSDAGLSWGGCLVAWIGTGTATWYTRMMDRHYAEQIRQARERIAEPWTP